MSNEQVYMVTWRVGTKLCHRPETVRQQMVERLSELSATPARLRKDGEVEAVEMATTEELKNIQFRMGDLHRAMYQIFLGYVERGLSTIRVQGVYTFSVTVRDNEGLTKTIHLTIHPNSPIPVVNYIDGNGPMEPVQDQVTALEGLLQYFGIADSPAEKLVSRIRQTGRHVPIWTDRAGYYLKNMEGILAAGELISIGENIERGLKNIDVFVEDHWTEELMPGFELHFHRLKLLAVKNFLDGLLTAMREPTHPKLQASVDSRYGYM